MIAVTSSKKKVTAPDELDPGRRGLAQVWSESAAASCCRARAVLEHPGRVSPLATPGGVHPASACVCVYVLARERVHAACVRECVRTCVHVRGPVRDSESVAA